LGAHPYLVVLLEQVEAPPAEAGRRALLSASHLLVLHDANVFER